MRHQNLTLCFPRTVKKEEKEKYQRETDMIESNKELLMLVKYFVISECFVRLRKKMHQQHQLKP